MNKIFIILQREYLTRVRKKSFIIMTIIGPLLFGSLMIVPALMGQMSDEVRRVAVVSETGNPAESAFINVLKDSENLKFDFVPGTLEDTKKGFEAQGYYAILDIPANSIEEPDLIKMWSDQKINYLVIDNIENQLRKEIESQRLRKEITALNLGTGYENFDKTLVERTTVKLDIQTRDISTGEKTITDVSMIIGIVGGILIYFFIFMFGSQVMRGVIEEKTSRIVEVIVSSVKPFQLMMGKILGLALVGLTQFALWIVLTLMIVAVASKAFPENFQKPQEQIISQQMPTGGGFEQQLALPQAGDASDGSFQFYALLEQVSIVKILLSFLFFFIFGYLMYAALFGAIGSAVDNEADTQQFMLPVTIPLVLSIVMLSFIMNNPHGPVAFWLSIIPLTSPVVMMIRIPFDPPVFDIVLSMVTLVLGWLGATWLAAKIYRTGILMYGKKPTWGELWKWIRVK
jgi:ABC-2 type transport system permease protein